MSKILSLKNNGLPVKDLSISIGARNTEEKKEKKKYIQYKLNKAMALPLA